MFGTSNFLGYCRKCNTSLSKMREATGRYCYKAAKESLLSLNEGSTTSKSLLDNNMGQQISWTTFVKDGCPVPLPNALDLLDKMLIYNYKWRWMAQEALNHTFFNYVRENVLGEVREHMAWEGLYKEKGR